MINNNMGVIHHGMGKPNLACHYFQMALKEDMSFSENDSKKGNLFNMRLIYLSIKVKLSELYLCF